ncbi:MAG: tyrosine--tRNA ligase [Patescibacteria group bacterium]
MNKKELQLELLSRGVEEIIDRQSLEKKLNSGKKLRIKLGIDPTSPNLHIGRTIPLLKLRDFQELGHKIIFIIGDFTGVIGDTSDKESERPMLDEKTVAQNMKNYVKQAEKILDIEKCEIHYNSEWLEKLDYHDIGKQADIFSLNEFISRENIAKRLDAGKRVSLRELLYPLMQGYDSVAVKADVEIGGTDQRFNLLAGRELQRHYNQPAQDIITNPLIEGLDGRKMSSSWGNTIDLLDPAEEIYGKVMSLRDELIIRYFVLTTRVPLKDIAVYEKDLKAGKNPRDYKMKLAYELVRFYHSENKAKQVAEEFTKVFAKKEKPTNVPSVTIKYDDYLIPDLLVELKLAKSKSEARRLVEQGGVRIDTKVKTDWKEKVKVQKGTLVQVGKKKFVEIR